MEWIRISQNKLKIMLTAEDARHYALRCEQADLADGGTRRAFRDILSDIHRDADFDACEEKVYIQMYPSKSGGCELFVTKIGTDTVPAAQKQSEEGDSVENPTPSGGKPHTEAYSFTGLDELLGVCARLLSESFSGESCAYVDERGRYWLLFSERNLQEIAFSAYRTPLFLCLHPYLAEYGRQENPDAARIFLSEHATCICPASAVEILGMLE